MRCEVGDWVKFVTKCKRISIDEVVEVIPAVPYFPKDLYKTATGELLDDVKIIERRPGGGA